jgi:dTDP-4-dehydrorhamnose 3,5-epimerase
MIRQYDAIQFEDNRGGISKLFNSLNDLTYLENPQQLLISRTTFKNTVRGLHFQKPPFLEKKLIYPISGKAIWLSLDVRYGTSFKKLYVTELDSKHPKAVIFEPGLAHGMISVEDKTDLIICASQSHHPNHSIDINVNDPDITGLLIGLLPKSYIYDETKNYKKFEDCCAEGIFPIRL